MVKLTIDNLPVEVAEGTTILDAAKTVGVFLPTLCYMKDLNDIGACRVCVAEVEGRKKLVTTCNTPVEEGMVVRTNSAKAGTARMVNMQLLLSQHDSNCTSCVSSTRCELQRLANELGVLSVPYEKHVPERKWDMTQPLIKEDAKCIKCMRCVQLCKNQQALGVWGLDGTGARTTVDVSQGREFSESDCALCGQCISACPTGALSARDDALKALLALSEPGVITAVHVSPAVLQTWGETFGLTKETATPERLVAALKKVGFHYVYYTGIDGDLSIMEESGQFIRKYINRTHENFPLFTSYCPAWVRFSKARYPELVGQISTAKSPQQMFGVLAKTHLAKTLNTDPSKIYCISLEQCIAKKAERLLPGMDSTGTGPDVDLVLTPDEIRRIISTEHIRPENLPEEKFDVIAELGQGSGVILRGEGGAMEAALRTVYYNITGKFAEYSAFSRVRVRNGWREANLEIEGQTLKVAVVRGLGNAQKLIEAMKRGIYKYDFVEVTACPGGCSQTVCADDENIESLYGVKRKSVLRFESASPAGSAVYEKLQNSDTVQSIHRSMSVDHKAWDMPQGR